MAEPERTDDKTSTSTAAGTQSGDTMSTEVHPAPAPEPLHGDLVNSDVIATDDPAPLARRRGPDPLALIVGLATLVMAVFAFVGELPDLSGFDPRWLLAGGAAVVGLVLLVGNLRGRSGGRRGDG